MVFILLLFYYLSSTPNLNLDKKLDYFIKKHICFYKSINILGEISISFTKPAKSQISIMTEHN